MKVNRLILILLSVVVAGLLSACTGAASTAWPGVTVNDSVAYLADGLSVYAVDLNTGTDVTRTVDGESQPLRFSGNSNQISFFAPPVLTTDGQLLVGSAGHSHKLYSLNPETFAENWVFEDAKDIYLGSPLVMNNRIYAPNGDGNLYVLDMNGSLVDTFDTPDHGLWSEPVTDGETIYLSSLDHNIYALDPATLNVKWTATLDGAINAAPTLSEDGRLYVGTLSQSLYAIDAASGDILWDRELDGWLYSSPALDNGTLYIGAVTGAIGGKVYAVDAETGSPRWEYTTTGAVAGRVLVLEDSVVFTTEKSQDDKGTVTALSKEGVLVWDETYEHNFYAGPILWNDSLLVAPSQSQTLLLSINPGSGSIKWKFPPEN